MAHVEKVVKEKEVDGSICEEQLKKNKKKVKYSLDLKRTGNGLKLLRQIAKFKAVDITNEYEISKSLLSKIENGEVAPNLSLLKYYSEIFGVKIDDLLVFESDSDTVDKAQELAYLYLKSKMDKSM